MKQTKKHDPKVSVYSCFNHPANAKSLALVICSNTTYVKSAYKFSYFITIKRFLQFCVFVDLQSKLECMASKSQPQKQDVIFLYIFFDLILFALNKRRDFARHQMTLTPRKIIIIKVYRQGWWCHWMSHIANPSIHTHNQTQWMTTLLLNALEGLLHSWVNNTLFL